MSYDVTLVEPVSKSTVRLPNNHLMTGGTYCIGGTNEAWLNITSNYAELYVKAFGNPEGIKCLIGMQAVDSISLLESAIGNLGDETDDDYWTATEGNAKKPLYSLLAMAKLRPDAIWEIDY